MSMDADEVLTTTRAVRRRLDPTRPVPRDRNLGTCWTSMHLAREREAAQLLRIPYERVQQVCLTPVAFTVGERFGRARRPPVEDVLHLDGWDENLPSAPDVRGLAAR